MLAVCIAGLGPGALAAARAPAAAQAPAATHAPASAQTSVRILVNDQPITNVDIQNRTQMLRVFSKGKQGEKDAIDQLVDERLMMQEATRRKVTISDADIDQEINNRAQQIHLTPAQFSLAMRHAGFDPTTFKSFLRANLAWSQIVRARFRATVKVTDQDVAAVLDSRKNGEAPVAGQTKPEEKPTSYEYMLQQVLFVVPTSAKPGVEAERQNQAAAFRGRFQGCDTSLQQVGGLPDVVVKPPVRREESQLPDDLKKELSGLAIGAISQPKRVSEGFQLLGICAKTAIPGATQVSEEVRDELSSERGKLLARRYLRDLRSDAVIEYK